MPPRVPSPFKPGRPALIEPIQQPLYSSNVIVAATPQATVPFFPVPAASATDPTRANIDIARLANPKIYVVRGYRLHVTQNVALVGGDVVPVDGLIDIAEAYWFRFFVGVKEYLRAPVFWMSSGLGIWYSAAGAGGEAINEFAAVASLGAPHRENYYKISRRPIVIPPQQEFQSDLNLSLNGITTPIPGGDRRVWVFLEGDLGREVQ